MSREHPWSPPGRKESRNRISENVHRRRLMNMVERWLPVSVPDAAFSYVPFTIQRNGWSFRPDPSWNISTQVSRSGGDRYVSKSGSDITGDGLSWDTAWLTISKAYIMMGATPNMCLYIGEGIYGYTEGWYGPTNTVSRSFIGVGKVELDGYFTENSYSLVAGKTYTYERPTPTAPIDGVLDYGNREADGAPALYSRQTSIDAVEANAGSFYYDWAGAKILYVHTLDEVAPDANVRSQYAGSNKLCKTSTAGINLYAENINVYCGSGSVIQANSNVYLKEINVIYISNTSSYCFEFTNNGLAVLQNCKWHDILRIGTSDPVDLLFGDYANVIEIDCEGSYSGGSLYTGSNSSTNHHTGSNVIINGEYHHNYGPPIGLILDGKCWLLGVYSHHNLATASNDANYQLDEAIAYLDNCRSSDSGHDIETTHTVYIRNFQGDASNTGGGSVVEY